MNTQSQSQRPVINTHISLGNTPASGGEDEALLTANETRTTQALVTIPVEPVKPTGEDADKFAEPITTTAPKGDNLGTASLTTIEGETHNPQTQTGSTEEVWQSQRNPKRKRGFHNKEPTTMTTSQGHKDTSVKNDYSPMFGIQVGADTYALRTELGSGHIPPKKYKKPRSGSQNNQPPSNPYKARHRPS